MLARVRDRIYTRIDAYDNYPFVLSLYLKMYRRAVDLGPRLNAVTVHLLFPFEQSPLHRSERE